MSSDRGEVSRPMAKFMTELYLCCLRGRLHLSVVVFSVETGACEWEDAERRGTGGSILLGLIISQRARFG